MIFKTSEFKPSGNIKILKEIHKEKIWPTNSDNMPKKTDGHRMFGIQMPMRFDIQQIKHTSLYTTTWFTLSYSITEGTVKSGPRSNINFTLCKSPIDLPAEIYAKNACVRLCLVSMYTERFFYSQSY